MSVEDVARKMLELKILPRFMMLVLPASICTAFFGLLVCRSI